MKSTSSTPGSIPQEHERRFYPQVKDIPKDVLEYQARSVIMQSYLEDEDNTRIREEIQNGTRTYTITRKKGSGITRSEEEFLISLHDYEHLLKGATCTLVKVRNFLRWNDINLELNTYYGLLDGYIQIEVEFGSHEEAVAFIPPEWFGREVTDDRSHGNYSLAKRGKPKV